MLMRPALLSICLAAGCAALDSTSTAADRTSVAGISGKSVMLVRRPDPGFQYVTSGGAAAGALAALGPQHDYSGAGGFTTAGQALVANDHIADPADALGATLLASLVDTYQLRRVTPDTATVGDDKRLDALVKQAPADILFEFYTEAWRTYYFLDSRHYDVWYYAKARLIDARTGGTLRRAKCAHKPDKTSSTPTLDELLADNGLKLREALDRERQLCLATVKEEFGIPASP